jgi:threonine synthase
MGRNRSRKNGTLFYQLHCISCGKQVKETESSTRCPVCHRPLDVRYDYDYIRSRLNRYSLRTSPIKALKYLDFYPLLDLNLVVSMNEGGTPLYRCTRLAEKIGLRHLYIKNEGANPTGVFKDRGSLVELTKAKEQGADAVCVASTGNMAASVAAYASVAGLPCYVLVPEGIAIGKMAQALSYGARVIQVRGTYTDAARLAERAAWFLPGRRLRLPGRGAEVAGLRDHRATGLAGAGGGHRSSGLRDEHGGPLEGFQGIL